MPKLTPAKAKKILAERQYNAKKPWSPLEALSKDGVPMWSWKAFSDPTRDRAICTTRQAGKVRWQPYA